MIKNALMVIGSAFLVLVLLVLFVGMVFLSDINREVGLRKTFENQILANESSFDKTWKVIKQSANIAETERESFKKTYVEIMTATKGVAGNGQLASFFTQSKIDISPELFSKLMTTVESQRESFNQSQLKLIDIKREHDILISSFPQRLYLRQDPLEIKLVTSEKTEEAFSTGQDNDVKLFGE